MRRKAKIKKLSTILVVYSMVILLVLNGITAIIMGMVAGSAMSDKQDAYLQKTVDSAEEQVTQYLSGYIRVAELVANDPTVRKMTAYANNTVSMSQAPDFQENIAMLREIKERYADILGFGIGNLEEDGIYAEDGKRYDVVLKERDYYAAVTENRTVVTQPYIDVTTKELCISIGVPIQQAGKTVGVLCLDLKLTEISNFLLNMAFGETGRAVLISEDNLIMGYTDPTRLGESFSSLGIKGEKFWKEYDSPTGKMVPYRLNGEERLAIFKTIDEYNWTLLVGMSKEEYNAQTVKEVVVLLLVLLCNLLIMSGFLWYIITKKLRPVGDINHALEQMSQGNLAIDVPHHSQDEIGEIAASIRACAKTLDSYVKEIDRSMDCLAEGDLTVTSSIHFKGDFAHIQYSIERFIRKLTILVSNISLSAEQVRAGSDQVAASSQTLAQGSVEQSAAMEKLVEIIADISEQIRSNATDTDTANRQVMLADKSLQESNTHMEQMVDAMNRISSDSEKIRSIIKTMEDIAFQTNILALNAAVEAARAGQAGKGFAVVADEVRNLSGKSAEAAKKISQLIQNSMLSIQDGEDATKNTTQSLQKTVEQAMGVAQMIDKISVASNHQADAIKDINQNMDEISNVVQSNSVAAEESAAASEEFSAQAQVLKELIGQFKLAEELVEPDMLHVPQFDQHDTESYQEEKEPEEDVWHPAPEASSNPFSDKY